jgi:hypothetical protein
MERKRTQKPKGKPASEAETDEIGGFFVMENRLTLQAPPQMEFRIPNELLKQFEGELRIVVRYPWIIGIPIPEWLIRNPELLGRASEEFEAMLIPRASMR